MSTAAPEWADWALRQPQQSHFTESAGVRLHYASWNVADTGKPVLLFAHGFLGNSHWWDFIAPFFTDRFRVFALDFSGMGDSAHRAAYGPTTFADDIAAALRATGTAPATVVGHSFGGSRLLQACTLTPALFVHAIVLDSYVLMQGESPPQVERRPAPRPYPDEATALARFRLLPEQPCDSWSFDHLARHSLCQSDAGWTWTFDPKLRSLSTLGGDERALRSITVPVSYVHAESSSVVSAERASRIVAAIPGARGPITMPRTYHHLMLDQPLALVGVLRALLA